MKKAVILAGGFGSRLSEETRVKPKPMLEIGGKPLLWHIMNIFSTNGICEFVLAAGYKSEVIKEYFLNFYALQNDITVDLSTGETIIHDGQQPRWKVHIVDTGLHTQTGGRLLRLRNWIDDEEPFFFTYGDGVADVDLNALLRFHQSHGKLATVTAVRTPARFGRISFAEDRVVNFHEKPEAGEGWINGGFFVLEKKALDYISDDSSVWEREVVEKLTQDGQLMGYRHHSFWSCVDTLKEKNALAELWESGNAPWKIWS